MTKKHWKRFIYVTYQRTFFEAANKQKKRKPEYGRKPVLMKLLTLFNYWSSGMQKLIAGVKIFLLT